MSGILDRFGEIAVWLGLVQREHVDEALEAQKASGQPIGHELTERGHIDETRRQTVLDAQKRARASTRFRRKRAEEAVAQASTTPDPWEERAASAAPPAESNDLDASVLMSDADTALPTAMPAGATARVLEDQAAYKLVAFEGVFVDEPEEFPEPIPRAPNQALIACLAGVETLTRGGAVALWYACGGERVILCNLAPEGMKVVEELGMDRVVHFAADRDDARAVARTLPPPEPPTEPTFFNDAR